MSGVIYIEQYIWGVLIYSEVQKCCGKVSCNRAVCESCTQSSPCVMDGQCACQQLADIGIPDVTPTTPHRVPVPPLQVAPMFTAWFQIFDPKLTERVKKGEEVCCASLPRPLRAVSARDFLSLSSFRLPAPVCPINIRVIALHWRALPASSPRDISGDVDQA